MVTSWIFALFIAFAGVSGTVGATTLTEKQLASHDHAATAAGGYYDNASTVSSAPFGTGVPSHQTCPISPTVSNAGSSASHVHSLAGVKSGSATSLPPYYALAFIMRIA